MRMGARRLRAPPLAGQCLAGVLLCASAGVAAPETSASAAEPARPTGSPAGSETRMKNSLADLSNVLGDRARQQWFGQWVGAIMLPSQRLVVCAPPKTGSTSAMRLLLRILGRRSAPEICRPDLYAPEPTRSELRKDPDVAKIRWNAVSRNAPDETKAWIHGSWADAISLHEAPLHLVREAFTSDKWTTVAQLRDPWWRAVSAYRYQIQVGSTRTKRTLDPNSASDFGLYTRKHIGKRHHAGPMSRFCALHQNFTYDVIIDVDSGMEAAWTALMERLGLNTSLLLTGWETCGSARLMAVEHADGINAGRWQPSTALTTAERQRKIDEVMCNNQTAAAVAARYAEDYRMVRRQGMALQSAPHSCVHQRH